MRRALQSAPTERISRVTCAATKTPANCPDIELRKLVRSTCAVSCITSVPITPNRKGSAAPKVEGRPTYAPTIRNIGAQTAISVHMSRTSGSSTST